MKPSLFVSRLRALKEIVLVALESGDEHRAALELGGYLSLLGSHRFGSSLIERWRRGFERDLEGFENCWNRLVQRLEDISSALVAALAPIKNQEDVAKSLENLGLLRNYLDAEWFGEQSGLEEWSAFSVVLEPLQLFGLTLERGFRLLHEHKLDLEDHRSALLGPFREANDSGDVPVRMLQSGARGVAKTLLQRAQAMLLEWPWVEQYENLVQEAINERDDLLDFLLFTHFDGISFLNERGATGRVPAQPTFTDLLGGQIVIGERRSSLGPAPRHVWWSLVRLLAVASHVEFDDDLATGGSTMLGRISTAARKSLGEHPTILQMKRNADIPHKEVTGSQTIRLELNKIQNEVELELATGRTIEYDLLRFRQRVEWYDREQFRDSVGKRKRDGQKLDRLEIWATRELAVWLADQGYVPVSKTLGVGISDLEADDPHGHFVIEAKVLHSGHNRLKQAGLVTKCRKWGGQAREYAATQGLDRAFVLVFNFTDELFLMGGASESGDSSDPELIYVPVNATGKTPSKRKGPTLWLREQNE